MGENVTKNPRDTVNDIVRIVAMFLVIGVHWVGSLKQFCPVDNMDVLATVLLGTINDFGVPIFFALSGYYLLTREYKNIFGFYYNRFMRIMVPYMIYAVLYVVYFVGIEDHEPGMIPLMYFFDILTANVHGTHWFVYSILGLYLSTPFLSKMFDKLSDKELAILYIIGISMALLNDIFGLFGHSFGIRDYTFSGNLLIFISGYCLNRLINTYGNMDRFVKCKWWIVVALIVLMYLSNFSALHVINAAVVVTGNENIKINSKATRIIGIISGYSYSTYLIHAAVISMVLKVYIEWQKFYILKLIIGNLIVYVISIIIVFIVDNILTNRIIIKMSRKIKE